jgi:hypothetical protein
MSSPVFGEAWKPPAQVDKSGRGQRLRSVIGDGAAAGADAAAAAAGQAGAINPALLPAIVGGVFLAVVIFAIIGSGSGSSATSAPKALIFVISGLKGTTFYDAAINGPFAPNINALVSRGAYAQCLQVDDGRCCRTQDGPRFGSGSTFGSAPGIASILTGVNADKHRVNNDSFSAMANFASSSLQFPTLLKMAKDRSKSTGIVGSQFALSALGGDGRCSQFGVVDFECGVDAASRCLGRSSCNADQRVSLPAGFSVGDTSPADPSLADFSRSGAAAALSSRVLELANDAGAMIAAGTDIVVVHVNALDIASTNAAAGGDYSVTSKLSMSTLYVVDAVVGQIAAIVQSRVVRSRENWLLLGVSDHGGQNSTFGTTFDQDEIVALFASSYTLAGTMTLLAPIAPVRQYDVMPTVLQWLGIRAPAYVDGTVQFICSDGINPTNCTAAP